MSKQKNIYEQTKETSKQMKMKWKNGPVREGERVADVEAHARRVEATCDDFAPHPLDANR